MLARAARGEREGQVDAGVLLLTPTRGVTSGSGRGDFLVRCDRRRAWVQARQGLA